jgi:hypothetical protein
VKYTGTARGIYTAANTQTRSDIFDRIFARLMLNMPDRTGNPVVLFWSLEKEIL